MFHYSSIALSYLFQDITNLSMEVKPKQVRIHSFFSVSEWLLRKDAICIHNRCKSRTSTPTHAVCKNNHPATCYNFHSFRVQVPSSQSSHFTGGKRSISIIKRVIGFICRFLYFRLFRGPFFQVRFYSLMVTLMFSSPLHWQLGKIMSSHQQIPLIPFNKREVVLLLIRNKNMITIGTECTNCSITLHNPYH